jgi:hypothetical protein
MSRSFRTVIPAWGWAAIFIIVAQVIGVIARWGAVDHLDASTRNFGIALIVGLCVPGVIRRGGIWPAVMMVLALALLAGLRTGVESDVAIHEPRLVRAAVMAVIVICGAAFLGDYLMAGGVIGAKEGTDRAAMLGKLPILAIAAAGGAAAAMLVFEVLNMFSFLVPLGTTQAWLAEVMLPILVGICAWGAVGVGLGPTAATQRGRTAVAGVAAVLVLLLPVWWVVRVPLAMRTLRAIATMQPSEQEGAISPFRAAEIVARHGKQADIDVMWEMAAHADKPPMPQDVMEPRIWPQFLVYVLYGRDHDEAGKRLSKLVTEETRPSVLAMAGPYLASQNCYDTLPLLLRFSMWKPRGTDPGIADHADACVRAAEQMKVPEAIAAILSAQSRDQMPPAMLARRLSNSVGYDVAPPGENDDELKWIHTQLGRAENPMTGEDRKLADGTIDAVYAYWRASRVAQRADADVPLRIDFFTPRAEEFIRQVNDYCARVDAATHKPAGPGTRP